MKISRQFCIILKISANITDFWVQIVLILPEQRTSCKKKIFLQAISIMRISKHSGTKNYPSKVGIIQKSLRILLIVLVWYSVPKNCAVNSSQKFVDNLRSKLLIVLVGSNGNIETFWHYQLYMKTWYSSKFFENIFEPRLFQYPQLTNYFFNW